MTVIFGGCVQYSRICIAEDMASSLPEHRQPHFLLRKVWCTVHSLPCLSWCWLLLLLPSVLSWHNSSRTGKTSCTVQKTWILDFVAQQVQFHSLAETKVKGTCQQDHSAINISSVIYWQVPRSYWLFAVAFLRRHSLTLAHFQCYPLGSRRSVSWTAPLWLLTQLYDSHLWLTGLQ